MTTFDPGASVVFTHGWVVRPRSTAFLASRAAPIMTCGLDVLVQDVIAAMTTWPWSTSVSVPSSMTTRVGLLGRRDTSSPSKWRGLPASPVPPEGGAAGAGAGEGPGRGPVGRGLPPVRVLAGGGAGLGVLAPG